MKPYIVERFADNGGHSHWSVIDRETGETLIENIMDYAIQPTATLDSEGGEALEAPEYPMGSGYYGEY